MKDALAAFLLVDFSLLVFVSIMKSGGQVSGVCQQFKSNSG